MIIKAHKSDIDGIVGVHIQAFKGHLLTSLGPSFLKLYYKLVLDYEKHILLQLSCDNKVIGFACGFICPQDFYRLLNSQRLLLAWSCLPGVIKSPSIIMRVAQNALNLTSSNDGDSESENACELSSIAVLPEYQDSKFGKKLLNSFENDAKQLGADSISLKTDLLDNDKVNSFYQRNGYKVMRVLNPYGKRPMNYFIKKIYT